MLHYKYIVFLSLLAAVYTEIYIAITFILEGSITWPRALSFVHYALVCSPEFSWF